MPEKAERTPPRKAVARDPLADLGEIAGVLRRVRPAAPAPGRAREPEAARQRLSTAASARPAPPPAPAAGDAAAAAARLPGADPAALPASPLPPAFLRRAERLRSMPLFEMLDEPAARPLVPRDRAGASGGDRGVRAQWVEERSRAAADAAHAEEPAGGPGPVGPAADEASETERLYDEAKRRAAAGEYGQAIDGYHEVLRRNPRHVRARNNLGFAYDCRGDYDLAVNEYLQALELDPKNVQVLCNLGAVYGAKGWYAKAEEVLKQALRLDPKSAQAHCNLGIVHCKKGMYHLATAELKRALELKVDYLQAYYHLGECYNHLDRYDDAIAAFERTLRDQPQNHKAYYNLGILFDKKNMPERAMLMYRRARELQGSVKLSPGTVGGLARSLGSPKEEASARRGDLLA